MLKKTLDLLLAILLFVPTTILILIAAAWIKLDSPGPALFKQVRVGKNQQPFTMIKLRTMKVGIGNHPSHHISSSDVTNVGRILRQTKIDELPQIWSVLLGDMSFVGPRPCLPKQVELIEARNRLNVYSVLPGITGPAQIQNIDMSTPKELAHIEGHYVANRSIIGDISYIWATIFGKGRGDAIR